MKFTTIREAAKMWVREDMTAIPLSVVEKLAEYSDYCDFSEITPVSTGCRAWSNDSQDCGEVVSIIKKDDEEVIKIRLDDGKIVETSRDDLIREDYGSFPMWGTMWSFNDICDSEWLEDEENLKAIAECGFRIYESEDYGYVFGIDGAGYDFYEHHWIPLYKARGLMWHNASEE